MLGKEAFQYYNDVKMQWVLEPGKFYNNGWQFVKGHKSNKRDYAEIILGNDFIKKSLYLSKKV